MNRNKLVRLEQIFRTFIIPLMDEEGRDDYDFIWEFERYLGSKKDEVANAEKQMRKWETPLLNK